MQQTKPNQKQKIKQKQNETNQTKPNQKTKIKNQNKTLKKQMQQTKPNQNKRKTKQKIKTKQTKQTNKTNKTNKQTKQNKTNRAKKKIDKKKKICQYLFHANKQSLRIRKKNLFNETKIFFGNVKLVHKLNDICVCTSGVEEVKPRAFAIGNFVHKLNKDYSSNIQTIIVIMSNYPCFCFVSFLEKEEERGKRKEERGKKIPAVK